MKTLRIDFLCKDHFNKTDNKIYKILSKKFKVIIDENNPDYIIVHAHRFLDYNIYKNHPIRIFHQNEANVPDFCIFDYAILRYDNIIYEDRCFYREYEWFWYKLLEALKSFKEISDKSFLNQKHKFCNFLYSNSVEKRDEFFQFLNKHKKVDSLGSHLNNTRLLPINMSRYHNNWWENSIKLKKSYKFSIAFENIYYPGYTSEKIISSLIARTIPIYWGNPKISQQFNPQAFINTHEFSTVEDIIKRINEIDSHDDLFLSMINEPWMTNQQLKKLSKNIQNSDKELEDFLFRIIDQPFKESRRRVKNRYSQKLYESFQDEWFLFGKMNKIQKVKFLLKKSFNLGNRRS